MTTAAVCCSLTWSSVGREVIMLTKPRWGSSPDRVYELQSSSSIRYGEPRQAAYTAASFGDGEEGGWPSLDGIHWDDGGSGLAGMQERAGG